MHAFVLVPWLQHMTPRHIAPRGGVCGRHTRVRQTHRVRMMCEPPEEPPIGSGAALDDVWRRALMDPFGWCGQKSFRSEHQRFHERVHVGMMELPWHAMAASALHACTQCLACHGRVHTSMPGREAPHTCWSLHAHTCSKLDPNPGGTHACWS